MRKRCRALLRRALLLLIPVSGLIAQPAAPKLEFEVASVRASTPYTPGVPRSVSRRGGPGTNDPDRLTIENYSLASLIMDAWDIKPFQLSGPDWLVNGFGPLSSKFDVAAKIPPGSTNEQFRVMMQNLLADRFKLSLHHEMKELPVYNLIVMKNGPKFKPSPQAPKNPAPDDPKPGASAGPTMGKDGFPVLPAGYTMAAMGNKARMRNPKMTMDRFVAQMSNQVGKTVIDKTGLNGEYDIELFWQYDSGAAADLTAGPTLTDAVQDQLGLKLESAKGLVDIIVIDHVEKTPSEN